MNRRIMGMVSGVYGVDYQAHCDVSDRTLTDFDHVQSNALTTAQILWIDLSGMGDGEKRDPATHSLYNPEEIDLCELVAKKFTAVGAFAKRYWYRDTVFCPKTTLAFAVAAY